MYINDKQPADEPKPSHTKETRLRQFADRGWLKSVNHDAPEEAASAVPQIVMPSFPQVPPQSFAMTDQWRRQVPGGSTVASHEFTTKAMPTAPVPSVSPTASWENPIDEDEDLPDDLFGTSNSWLLATLGWPFRMLATLFKPRQRVPAFVPISITECGAACLAMILTYHGCQKTTGELSEECGVGRDGLSASSIVKAARRYGLLVQAIAFQDIDTFESIDLPAIVHWQFNHFIIVEHWSPQQIHVVDPAGGRKILTREEFDNSFTGVTIVLQPGPHFVKHRGSSRNTLLRSYVQQTIGLAPSSLLQVLLGSIVLLTFGLVAPATTAMVVNTIVPQSLSGLLLTFGLGMIGMLTAQMILNYTRSILLIKLQAKIDTSLMVSFFDHLLSLPLRYFQLRTSGDILARLASNTVIRDTVNSQLVSSILDSTSVIVYLIILVSISRVFALLAVFFGLTQAILMIATNQPILSLFRSDLEAQAKEQGYLTEAMVEITTLKAAGAEKHVRARWLRLFLAEMSSDVQLNKFLSMVTALQSFIRTLGPVVLLLVGAQQVISGAMLLGTMMALFSLVNSFLAPLQSLVSTGQQIQQAYAHMERIADVMNAEPEQLDTQQIVHPPRLTGHIQLINVSFHYDINAQPVLHDINLTIYPGQKIAIVGRSGSGKSTLGKLLLGLYLPSLGEIFYDKIPLRKMNYQEVRAQFGVVMQDIGLFNGSIRENIAFNTPGVDISSVVQAAQAAAIHDDIMHMPMDYETIVAEGGKAISGGQRQRLALARALIRKPAILLLDEATSSLDVATERVIEHNLRNLACTQIIIAHRLSTIRNADLILAVDQGTIVEGGTHEELLKHQAFYARLIESQLENGELVQR